MKSILNGQQHDIRHSHANAYSVQVKERIERCRAESASDAKMITNCQQVSEVTYDPAHQIITTGPPGINVIPSTTIGELGAIAIGQSEVFTPCIVSWPVSSLISAAPNHQCSQTSLASFSYADNQCNRLSAAKALGNLEPVFDEHEEDDASSEVEICYSDSELSDDEDLVADSATDNLAAKLKSLVFNLLESKYSAGLFNSCGSGESTASHPEGSGSSAPPSKRRSVGLGKSVSGPQGDDPDDDGDEAGESYGQNIEEKSNVPSQSRKWFACQFFQRDPKRCTNRSCSGPGWPLLHRLK
jgi:hypothetical protein